MRDEVNQNISRLLDDDLGYDETLILLNKIQTDEALKYKMLRYQAISQVLKNEEYFQIRPDFSAKIAQQIELEPTYLLPQRKQPRTNTKIYFAAAASALIAAVLVGQQLRNRVFTDSNNQVTAATSPTNTSLPVTLAGNRNNNQNTRHPLTAQFNDYLQAHNSSVYTNGEANFHPYAKMAAYGKE
ncbi:MAG: sigma-E factor negative regulatory protein [Methylococcaceae bacterium]|nr:sigma-E factor negative regulatory protein [Methylococcaceae bacterium]